MSFLNNETYRNFDTISYDILSILYKKETLTKDEIKLFYIILPFVELYVEKCFQVFLEKHIEIINSIVYEADLYEFIKHGVLYENLFKNIPFNLRSNFLNKRVMTKDNYVMNFCYNYLNYLYDFIFKYLSFSSKYEYWIENISSKNIENIPIIVLIDYQGVLIKCLTKYDLLDKFTLPRHNLILLHLCGIWLDNDDFLNIYKKCELLTNESFLYELLRLREKNFTVPNKLKHIYLMEELQND